MRGYEVAVFSPKKWDRRGMEDLIQSLTPCHNTPVMVLDLRSNFDQVIDLLAILPFRYLVISVHLVEFSNVHNCGRSSNATQSNLAYKIV